LFRIKVIEESDSTEIG